MLEQILRHSLVLKLLDRLSKSKRVGLRKKVGHELIVAAHNFTCRVFGTLRLSVSNEFSRNNSTLVHQLIEGVLAIGAGFAKNNGSSRFLKTRSVDSNTLSVAFHVKLLDVSGEAQEGLTVRQNCARLISTNEGVVKSN